MSSASETATVAAADPRWVGLIDDAAIFPPGNAAVPAAVSAHSTHRAAPYAPYVGPLLLSLPALPAFAEARNTPGANVPRIALAIRPGAADLAAITSAVADAQQLAGTELVAVEMALPQGTSQVAAAAELIEFGQTLPTGVTLWLELRAADDTQETMALIAKHAATQTVGAKYRTGGTEAAAFPPSATLAEVLFAAAQTQVPLKLTAGLHHLHPYEDNEIGARHHGFGNVLCAIHTSFTATNSSAAEAVLAKQPAAETNQTLSNLSTEETHRLRAVMVSFGCCGVTDPINDLVANDLLSLPV